MYAPLGRYIISGNQIDLDLLYMDPHSQLYMYMWFQIENRSWKCSFQQYNQCVRVCTRSNLNSEIATLLTPIINTVYMHREMINTVYIER